VAKFIYLGTTESNRNSIQEEIKRRLNAGIGCYYAVQNLLSKNSNMYNAIILRVKVLHGCETWSLTLWEEHRLRVFENRVRRRIFRPKREEVAGSWRRLHNVELRNLYPLPNITWVIKSRWMRWGGHEA
jgi:hypothetical protein